jgi:iron-sulfur cluster insertion protein
VQYLSLANKHGLVLQPRYPLRTIALSIQHLRSQAAHKAAAAGVHKEQSMNAAVEQVNLDAPPMQLVFTDSAAAKVKELIEEEGNADLKLRVFVQGGGCSGFQYGFTFDEDVNDDDTTFEKNGVSLLIDAMSFQYLVGAEIDYKEGLEGAQFVIKNPNASSSCGCGSSFSV